MSPIKVTSVGSDRSVFVQGSPARVRAEAYAKRFSELHVVVFSLRSHNLQPVHENSLHIYPTNSFFRLAYLSDAARIVRRIPAEVVTVQDPFESGLAGLLGRRGRPLHVQLHTDPFALAFKRSFLNRARLFIMRFVLARAAGVRVVSKHLKESIRTRYPKLHVSVIPIYADIKRFSSVVRAPHARFSPALLWIGRFEDEKNPQLALRSLVRVRKEYPNAGLTMLGDGSLKDSLHSLAKTLRVEEWVEFPGWGDPVPHLAHADVVLATSLYEGYGRQIVEALAAGVPVLSTDVGIARQAGATIASENAFADTLLSLCREGKREASLSLPQPHNSEEEYVQAYCEDLRYALDLNV